MKKIAVITGASSGMGRRFAETLEQAGVPIDEVWLIARRAERLQAVQTPAPARAVPLDLTDRDSFTRYRALLESERPEITLLVNASGFGKFQATADVPLETNLNMVDLNCQAVMAMCQLSLPYMRAGAKIVNIASVAAYQPIPYINVYGATKSFALHFSRALNREVRGQGIAVMAVCPFWTKTEFFDHAVNTQQAAVVKKYVAMYQPEQIVSRAWRDLRRGRDVSQYGFIARFQTLLAKLLPHSFVMSYWLRQQKLNEKMGDGPSHHI